MHISNRELVRRVGERTALPKKLITRVLSHTSEEIQTAMAFGDTVTIHGLGRFTRKIFHSGRQVTPTGRLVDRFINKVYFRAGGVLKRAMGKSSEVFDAAEKSDRY